MSENDHSDSALLPCPFCGQPPESFQVGELGGGGWQVDCTSCGNNNDTVETVTVVHGDDQSIAEAAWNKRATGSSGGPDADTESEPYAYTTLELLTAAEERIAELEQRLEATESARKRNCEQALKLTERLAAAERLCEAINQVSQSAVILDLTQRLAAAETALQAALYEGCEDCDHGIRGGKPCESCGGSGRVVITELLTATQQHVKELKVSLEAAKKDLEEGQTDAVKTIYEMTTKIRCAEKERDEAARNNFANCVRAQEAERRISELAAEQHKAWRFADTEQIRADKAETALQAAREGAIPKEPTEAMCIAGDDLIRYDIELNGLHTSALGVWRAMIRAIKP